MKQLFMTGVGSRETPIEICTLMTVLTRDIAGQRSLIVRTGDARGADKAFRDAQIPGTEVYSPRMPLTPEAFEIAESIHPVWHKLDEHSRKMHARNTYQVNGYSLNLPSDFMVCWTVDGKDKGGTRTAIVYARRLGIPIFNLGGGKSEFDKLRNFLQNLGIQIPDHYWPYKQPNSLNGLIS